MGVFPRILTDCQKSINMWLLYLESWSILSEKVQRKQWHQELILSTELGQTQLEVDKKNPQAHRPYAAANGQHLRLV